MDGEQREMSLKEWCERLPEHHRVNEELRKITKTLALLNSMILSGEQHSEQSSTQVKESFALSI